MTSLTHSNYGEDNEDNGDLLQKIPCMSCYTQCPQTCSRSPLTHASTGDSWASLGQSLVGSLLLFPGSWCTQGSVCALKCLCLQSCVSSGGSMVGLMAISSKRAYATPRSDAPEPLALWQATADPYLLRRHSNTQRQVWFSLCEVWCAQGFV